MNGINTILFDFDGTIMDTNDLIIHSWQHTFRVLEGRERPVDEIVGTLGETLHHTLGRLLPEVPLEEAVAAYRGYHADNFRDAIKIYPGVKELLTRLKELGYALGIVTSRMSGTTKQGLEKYALDELFDVVVTCEDCTKHKPDPEPVRIALEKLGKKPEEALMVGDTLGDIKSARAAGAGSVLVDWALSVSEEERTGADAPDYIIEKAEDLLEILAG
ncbi:MAG: HAD-IA family hydrolase [Clostridiales Family XIII bacterium]|jgi:pyrophosphatase PpaX|nr:HAD-IA family hydrolase [Clostridiales Family XIII bacterium]